MRPGERQGERRQEGRRGPPRGDLNARTRYPSQNDTEIPETVDIVNNIPRSRSRSVSGMTDDLPRSLSRSNVNASTDELRMSSAAGEQEVEGATAKQEPQDYHVMLPAKKSFPDRSHEDGRYGGGAAFMPQNGDIRHNASPNMAVNISRHNSRSDLNHGLTMSMDNKNPSSETTV